MGITRNAFIILNIVSLLFYVLATIVALAGHNLTNSVISTSVTFAVIGIAVHLYVLVMTSKFAYFTL